MTLTPCNVGVWPRHDRHARDD